MREQPTKVYDEFWREYDDTTEREWRELCKNPQLDPVEPAAYLMRRNIDKEVIQAILTEAQQGENNVKNEEA